MNSSIVQILFVKVLLLIHQFVHQIVILSKIILLYYEHHFPSQKIFHQSVVNLVVIVYVHHVQKLYVEKILLFKYIVQAIHIFQDNVVINLIALRVGENI